jgi:VWFA-related protein
MRRLAVIACLAAAPILGRAHQDRPVFRADANAVLVDVSVTDGRTSVANLTPADFIVLDNGVQQTVTELDFGRLPMDVRIVFDTSGSVSDAQLAKHVHAMTQVGAALKPGDRCEAWAFARHMVDVVPLSDPPIDAHLSRSGSDGTSFFDAVSVAMITVPRPGRRQLTIVLTDGYDTSSFFDGPALARAAQHTDAVVYAVSPPAPAVSSGMSITLPPSVAGAGNVIMTHPPPSAATAGSATRVLEALAKTTGGRLLTLDNKGDIGASFLKAIEEFRQSYLLRYRPEGVTSEGWHTLAVSVRSAKKYTVRAKQGYEGGK